MEIKEKGAEINDLLVNQGFAPLVCGQSSLIASYESKIVPIPETVWTAKKKAAAGPWVRIT